MTMHFKTPTKDQALIALEQSVAYAAPKAQIQTVPAPQAAPVVALAQMFEYYSDF